VVEHYLDTVGVGSSILPAPTVLRDNDRLAKKPLTLVPASLSGFQRG